jgi:DNA-binding CsgD family transcriptional regulator
VSGLGVDGLGEGAELAAPESELAPWPSSLTRREKQIARLICEGRTRGEVVESLGFAPKTFDSHRYEMMRKLGVRNEVQLVRKAIAKRWVRGDDPIE